MNHRLRNRLIAVVLGLLLVLSLLSIDSIRIPLSAGLSTAIARMGPRITLSGTFFSFFEARLFTKKVAYRTSVCDEQNNRTEIIFPPAINIPHDLHGKWVQVMGHYVTAPRSSSGYAYFEVESIMELLPTTPTVNSIAAGQASPTAVWVANLASQGGASPVAVPGRITMTLVEAAEVNTQGTHVGMFSYSRYYLEGVPLLFHTEPDDSKTSFPENRWVTVVGYNRLCQRAIEVITISEVTPLFTETPTSTPTSSSLPTAKTPGP